MARRPQRRVKKTKKIKVKKSKPPLEKKQAYQARVSNELGVKARQIGERILDVAEKDPEKFVRAVQSAADGVEKLYAFFQTNPKQARKIIGAAALSGLAKIAKRKLEEV